MIDVFIALKMKVEITDSETGKTKLGDERLSGGNILPVPDWKYLQKLAAENRNTVNVYTEDKGNSTTKQLLKSITSYEYK